MLSGYKYFEKKAKEKTHRVFQATQKLAHISPGLTTEGRFPSTDVEYSKVFENLELKQKLLAEFDSYAHEDQVFASNTSTSIADIAKNTSNPEKS